MIIDHIGITVKNYTKSKKFYVDLLVSIDIVLVMEYQGWAGFGRNNKPEFWITENNKLDSALHIAFGAENREKVRNFYDTAIKLGEKDNGAPAIRDKYHQNYYGAFIIDHDGNNIEAVCHNPE